MAVYTIAPAVRPPEEVVESLFRAPGERAPGEREGPRHKRLWATLAGKDAALDEVAAHVARRDGPHIAARVALTDGSQALQDRVRQRFPDAPLILDLIHATESLWDAANALLGEEHPWRTNWVKAHTLSLLRSRVTDVVDALSTLAEAAERTATQAKVLRSVAAYLARNAPYMDYAPYLARGWPLAAGVIEGACRHLVKDRCERSGMRWTLAGAEALLHLRCVQENGDWDAYHAFRKRRRHQRLYATPYPDDAATAPDLRALEPGAVLPPARAA